MELPLRNHSASFQYPLSILCNQEGIRVYEVYEDYKVYEVYKVYEGGEQGYFIF